MENKNLKELLTIVKYHQNIIDIRTLIFISFLTLIISCKSEGATRKDWIFQATYDSGAGGCSIVFYRDSTCTWMAGFASDDTDGKYLMTDSLITLEGIPMETCLTSNKLLLTNLNPHQSAIGDTILVQVDSQLKVVDSTYIFKVYWNNSHRTSN